MLQLEALQNMLTQEKNISKKWTPLRKGKAALTRLTTPFKGRKSKDLNSPGYTKHLTPACDRFL